MHIYTYAKKGQLDWSCPLILKSRFPVKIAKPKCQKSASMLRASSSTNPVRFLPNLDPVLDAG